MKSAISRSRRWKATKPSYKIPPMPPTGITLIEVVVAVFILVAGIAMVSNLFVKSIQISKRSENLTVATQIARNQLDQMIRIPYSEFISNNFDRTGMTIQDSLTFKWVAEVEDLSESLAQIQLLVTWPTQNGVGEQEFTCIRRK